jgi:hypothetical protein
MVKILDAASPNQYPFRSASRYTNLHEVTTAHVGKAMDREELEQMHSSLYGKIDQLAKSETVAKDGKFEGLNRGV